jgi:nicotinamide-nucleotide amidase
MKKLIKKVRDNLIKKKITLSVAESCTGGLLSYSLTSLPGSSIFFKLGLVTYSNKSKISILNVPKKVLKKYGAVSNNVCLAMANNLNKISKTSISISITGIAGPNGASNKKPVGLVFIGIKKGNKAKVYKHFFKNTKRAVIQKNAVKESLKLILIWLK